MRRSAVRDSRAALRRAGTGTGAGPHREHPGARLVVTGCAAQTEPQTFAAMPEVDQVIGNLEKMRPETWERIA
ncbi:MAG: hypothetical protein ACOC84_04515, partial [Actinomycetota bacterium]